MKTCNRLLNWLITLLSISDKSNRIATLLRQSLQPSHGKVIYTTCSHFECWSWICKLQNVIFSVMSGIPWSVGKITTSPGFKNTFNVLQKHSKIGNMMESNRSVTAAEILFFLYFLCIICFEYFSPLNPSLSVPLLEEPCFLRCTLSSSS